MTWYPDRFLDKSKGKDKPEKPDNKPDKEDKPEKPSPQPKRRRVVRSEKDED